MPEFRRKSAGRSKGAPQTHDERFFVAIIEAERGATERLYEIMVVSGGTAALWPAWGTFSAIVASLREAGGSRLIDDWGRLVDFIPKADLDRVPPGELQADAP